MLSRSQGNNNHTLQKFPILLLPRFLPFFPFFPFPFIFRIATQSSHARFFPQSFLRTIIVNTGFSSSDNKPYLFSNIPSNAKTIIFRTFSWSLRSIITLHFIITLQTLILFLILNVIIEMLSGLKKWKNSLKSRCPWEAMTREIQVLARKTLRVINTCNV